MRLCVYIHICVEREKGKSGVEEDITLFLCCIFFCFMTISVPSFCLNVDDDKNNHKCKSTYCETLSYILWIVFRVF